MEIESEIWKLFCLAGKIMETPLLPLANKPMSYSLLIYCYFVLMIQEETEEKGWQRVKTRSKVDQLYHNMVSSKYNQGHKLDIDNLY